MNLTDVVTSIIKDFINTNTLFTALDVSNKVKETLPLARHKDVREIVRSLFSSEIETAGWTRSPITVTLADNSTADALLYHSLMDTWDLDFRYNAQQRAQTSVRPQIASVNVVPLPVTVTNTTTISSTVAASATSLKDAWEALFKSTQSLFPNK